MKLKKTYTVFLLSMAFYGRTSAQGVDIRLLESINPRYPNSQYWKYTSLSAYVFTGAATVGPLIYGLASDDEVAKHKSYEIITCMALSNLLMEGLKVSVNRTRPGDKHPDLIF